MIEEGRDLSYLLDYPESSEDLEYDHRMDISGSVYTRMRELEMTQADLAEEMGVDQSTVSKIITGKQNITLRTLSRLESALGFRLDSGFRYQPDEMSSDITLTTSDAGKTSGAKTFTSSATSYTTSESTSRMLRLVDVDRGVAA